MHPAAVQGIVALALIVPATVLLHRGIDRDIRRHEQRLHMADLVRAATAMAPHLTRLAEALRDLGPASDFARARLHRWSVSAAAAGLSPTKDATR